MHFILQHITNEGRPPTQAEIADAMGYSTPSGARCHMQPLVRKQYIERPPRKACGIKPLETAWAWYAQRIEAMAAAPALEAAA